MDAKSNRRKCKRQVLDPPELGYLLPEHPGHQSGTPIMDPPPSLFVDVLNRSQGGTALKTPRPIEPETAVSLLTYNDNEKLGIVHRDIKPANNKKSLTTLHLIYQDEQRPVLKQLLEDFNARARKIGIELKAVEFPEIRCIKNRNPQFEKVINEI